VSGKISAHIRSNLVGYVALFIALSGTAWAAGKIGTRDIRTNAVRSRQIKNGQVKTPDVANNSIGGQQINEATLGLVPLAQTANRVATLHVASGTRRKAAAGTSSTGSLVKMAVGDSVTLFQAGPFTFTGKCTDKGGGDVKVAIEVTSSEDGWIGGGPYPDNVTPRAAGTKVELVSADSTGPVMPTQLGGQAFAAPSGFSVVMGNETVGVHVLNRDCVIASAYAVG
jgi:hypothetical protein